MMEIQDENKNTSITWFQQARCRRAHDGGVCVCVPPMIDGLMDEYATSCCGKLISSSGGPCRMIHRCFQ